MISFENLIILSVYLVLHFMDIIEKNISNLIMKIIRG
jgi:hypothetical protein